MLNKQALASKHLSPEVEKLLQMVINIANNVRTRSLKARMFARLCEEMAAEYISLIYYCESRWQSQRKF
jgi:hypothetical protein